MRVSAIGLFLIVMAAQSAQASVVQRTTYRPFIVHGKTAKAIYQSVVNRSQRQGKFRTYATTEVRLNPSVHLVTKPSCKVDAAIIEARFVIRLPQLANEAALAPALRSDWTAFVGELKRHEEHHRDIWLGCAADFASAVTGAAASDCKTFTRSLGERIRATSKACRARNDAFDEQAQSRLPGNAFIRRALLQR
jgi:predicted secreted Zn-dependent protease